MSDGECDDHYTFGGLGTLIRMCEVDFNCRIAIDVDDLRPGNDGAGGASAGLPSGTSSTGRDHGDPDSI